MTDSAQASHVAVPPQGGPPLADTADMAQVHRVFRNAIAEAPALIGSAGAGGADRVQLVTAYFDNVLRLLHAHHDGEDALIWPLLCKRVPERADEIRRVAGQHDAVSEALATAQQRIIDWQGTPASETATAATAALADLGAALLPHLDEEEAYIVPLAAEHLYAPEWGELPGHAMRTFDGDKLWLILGLVREQMRPDQIAEMEAHMPPPVLQMWNDVGDAAFAQFIGALRE